MSDPRPAAEARSFVILAALSLLIGGLNLWWTAREVNGANTLARAQCQFDADLGTAPLTVPAGGQPSRLGVTIIADARAAWRQAGCPGHLGPPDPVFARWAATYRLPAS